MEYLERTEECNQVITLSFEMHVGVLKSVAAAVVLVLPLVVVVLQPYGGENR